MSYVRRRKGSREPIPGGVQCPVCGLWFKNERALNSHMKVHKYKRVDEEQTVNIPNPTTEPNPTQQQPQITNQPQSLPMQMVQDPNSIPLPFGVQSPPIPGQQQPPNWLMNLIAYVGQKLVDKYLGGGNDKMMEFVMNLAFDSLKWRLGIADEVIKAFVKSSVKNPELLEKFLLGSQSTGGGGTS